MPSIRQVKFAGIAIVLGGAALWAGRVVQNSPVPAETEKAPAGCIKIVVAPPKPSGSGFKTGSIGFPQPSVSASDDELLQLARKLVAHSPQEALAWAQMQTDLKLKARMMLAVLQAWGEIFPAAAVNWAMTQPENDRQNLTEAALTGGLRIHLSTALEIANRLLTQDPDFGGACVGSLISKFSAAQHFETAAQLAGAAPDDFRADWTSAVFCAWAQNRPEGAMQAMDSIQDAKLRETIFQSVVKGWAAGSPASLAAYAEMLPPGSNRESALTAALDNWSLQDPAGMAAWLNTLPPGPDFDAGASLLLSKADGANLTPEVAMQWVESIGDSTLKLDSFAHVLVQWHQADSAASRQYVTTAKWLSDTQRENILKALARVQ